VSGMVAASAELLEWELQQWMNHWQNCYGYMMGKNVSDFKIQ
jgi:hypothetical protein